MRRRPDGSKNQIESPDKERLTVAAYSDAFLMSIVRQFAFSWGELVVWIVKTELDLVPSPFAAIIRLDQSQV